MANPKNLRARRKAAALVTKGDAGAQIPKAPLDEARQRESERVEKRREDKAILWLQQKRKRDNYVMFGMTDDWLISQL